MAAPIDADWANNNISDTNLNATTHGSGTTATRTGLSTWPANRPFFDTTDNSWYYNSHVSAPSSITWSKIEGRNTQTQRSQFGSYFYWGTTSSSGTRQYWSPIGFGDFKVSSSSASATAANVSLEISEDAITITRIRFMVYNDGVTTGTYDIGLWNQTDGAAIDTSLDGTTNGAANVRLDSGALSVSVTAGDRLCFYYEPNGTTGTACALTGLVQYEYDDLF